MSTKESGKMIKHMEEEYTTTMTVQAIQANGLRIFNKDMEFRNG